MNTILKLLLTESPEPVALGSIEAWWRQHVALVSPYPEPADLALAGGFRADRLGYAFCSGYHAALWRLVPTLPPDKRVALCATEAMGGHPSHIQTRVRVDSSGSSLNGEKAFVTLGTHAEVLLIVASEGRDELGYNRLRVVRVDAQRKGIQVLALPELPFVPEVPHAELRLDNVEVFDGEVLAGDGYTRYLKPFRTVEDCHVHLALLGWLIQLGRRCGWPEDVREELLALAVMMRELATADPAAPTTHVALGGALALVKRTLTSIEPLWALVDAPTRERWERDRRLLGVAGKVRAKRLEAARVKLTGGAPTPDV
ncbi:acyl-CoA dehydrogenase family protein [Myxococcus faecalis]|uniref:acyl-CoA dehydrogenase family protein n=1 Tax=Myxococcus faecalis TaxID=3115646 RepID=UPI003CFA177A